MASAQLISVSTSGPLGFGGNVGVGERGVCTLLGPEGPDVGTHAVFLAFLCLPLWWVFEGPPVL